MKLNFKIVFSVMSMLIAISLIQACSRETPRDENVNEDSPTGILFEGIDGETFEHVFGIKYGKVMSNSEYCITNEDGVLVYEHQPKRRFRNFSDCILFATPISRQIERMRMVCQVNADNAYDEFDATIQDIEGKFKRSCIKLGDQGVILFDNGDRIEVSIINAPINPVIVLDVVNKKLSELSENEVAQSGLVRNNSDVHESSDASTTDSQDGAEAIAGLIEEMVSIPGKDWKIGKFEVSQEQWSAIMGKNPSRRKGPNLPVDNVSFSDCKQFLHELNEHPLVKSRKLAFRLPSGSEWEFACRAGGTKVFCRREGGSEISDSDLFEVAWFGDTAEFKSHPRGSLFSNAFGLFDMLGNVSEWTSPENGCLYARGGCWDSVSVHCTAERKSGPWNYDDRADTIGFRIVSESSGMQTSQRQVSPTEKRVVEEIIAQLVSVPGKDYRIGKFEVTVRQWNVVMGQVRESPGDNYPIDRVSWNEIGEFIEKLNSNPVTQTYGHTFRLPTKSEWQYACKAGSFGKFCKTIQGEDIDESSLSKVAWFDSEDNAYYSLRPVGQKCANAFGLYDMLGNVAEWVADGAYRGTHFICGGGYDSPGEMCSANYSDEGISSASVSGIGFRLCATVSPEGVEMVRKMKEETVRQAREKEEAARKAREESERIEREKAEAERKVREEASRIAREKEEAERKAREEAEMIAKKKAEAERKAREEAERIEREKKEAEKMERLNSVTRKIIADMVQIPDKNYQIGKFEVTQAQYQSIMGVNPSLYKGEDNPVEQVSWDDCQKFLNELNKLPNVKSSGLLFRLPTEEEWEYACRAGARGDFCLLPDGSETTIDTFGQVAWFSDNSDKKTHPVGQKKPNAFGLFDMHGNVCEWTSTEVGYSFVCRGGSWINSTERCKASFRGKFGLKNRFTNLGFRLCASTDSN